MSKALSGWQSRIVWAAEANIGTAVTPEVLWLSNESDSLVFNEAPIDLREAFTAARGAVSTQLRTGVFAPGGDLGGAPIYLDGSSTNFLQLSYCFFQSYVRGTEAANVYTYTFSPSTAQIDEASFKGLTVLKDTGMGAGACPIFTGCIISTMKYSWDFGGAILQTPTLLALDADDNGTAPGAIAAPTAGWLQAPNIAVTFNGSTIHPVGWTITLDNGATGVTGPSTASFRTFSLGQATGEVELKTWRDDDFYGHFVANYDAMTIGTLVITATVDTSYGTHTDGSAYTATWTLYVRSKARPELSLTTGEMIDTVTLDVVYDTYPTLVVNSLRTANL